MHSFAVVCEARADFETATELADRVSVGAIDWLDPETLDHLRTWRGDNSTKPFLTWSSVGRLAKEHGIRVQGHFDEEPAAPDARAARRALRLLRRLCVPLHGVLLIRDDDGDSRRRQGLEQARSGYLEDLPIVIGLARTKRECWVLAGFEPRDAEEQERLESLRVELGFDPARRAEGLTAKHGHDRRSAKRVLGVLTGNDRDRERSCWRDTPLESLEARGLNTGLKAYLQEVEDHLVATLQDREPDR